MTVQRVDAEVSTGGVVRETSAATVTREIASTSPPSLGIPGGVMAGTSDASLGEPDVDVRQGKRSPWDRVDGWPPAEGEPCELRASLGGVWSTRFTGVLDDVAGSARGDVTVSGVDAIDRLDRRLTFEPLANPMPVQAGSTSVSIVNPLLRHEYYVERALRVAGWWAGPRPAISARALHLPLSGAILAGGGQGERAIATPDHLTDGEWHQTEWGLGLKLRSPRIAWELNRNAPSNNFEVRFYAQHDPNGPASQGFNLRMSSSPTSAGTSTRRAWIRVETTPTGIVVRTYRGATSTESNAYGASGTGPLFDVRVIRDDDQHGISINGSAPYWTEDVSPSTATGRYVHLEKYGSRDAALIGHLIAGQVGEVYDPTPPNAELRIGDLFRDGMGAGRYVHASIVDILRDIAHATNASAWIDSAGRFIWAHPDALEAQEPEAVLDSDADLLDLAWRHSLRDVRSIVRVDSMTPVVTTSDRADVRWWTGEGDTFPAGDSNNMKFRQTVRELVTPAANVDWFPAKLGPYTLEMGTASKNEFALMEADWYGASVYHGSITDAVSDYEGSAFGSTRKITSQQYEASTTIYLAPGNSHEVSPRIPSHHFLQQNHPEMIPHNGNPLPVVRGFGKIEWEDAQTAKGNAEGPEHAADYIHDAGWWLQGTDNYRLADWMATQLTKSRPLIDSLPIVPRHDLELGQVVTVNEHHVYGVSIRALIVGIAEQYDNGMASMTLTLRVFATAQAPEVEGGSLTMHSSQTGEAYWTRYGDTVVLEVDAAGTYEPQSQVLAWQIPERGLPAIVTAQNIPGGYGISTGGGYSMLYAQMPSHLSVNAPESGTTRVYGSVTYAPKEV